MTKDKSPDSAMTGALKPVADHGIVVVENPPAAPMHMTPDQADVSGVRLLDVAEKARRARLDPDAA